MKSLTRLAFGLAVGVAISLWPAISSGQPAPGTTLSPPPSSAVPEPQDGGHAGHGAPQPAPPLPQEPQTAPAAADHSLHQTSSNVGLPSFIPPITDEDRKAAFPDVQGHSVHDNAINSFVLFDQLEWQIGRGDDGLSWDNKGWVGQDRNRLWFRTEGESEDGRIEGAEAHALYGRAIARWWDLVAGARQDFRPGRAQTWAAVGIQGLAPYWFEVEATAYVGASGRTHLRLETEYELLLTNRLILQPLVEVQIYGKDDPARGIGAGLSSTDAGLRLRYELRREFAPYVGVTWTRQYFGTADLSRVDGRMTSGARLAVGLRLWL